MWTLLSTLHTAPGLPVLSQHRIPLNTMLQAAGWSNWNTFTGFYHKSVVQSSTDNNGCMSRAKSVAHTVLDKFVNKGKHFGFGSVDV